MNWTPSLLASIRHWLPIVALLCMLSFTNAFAQDETGKEETEATETEPEGDSKLKFANKIIHWLTAYGMSSPDFLEEQRKQFKAKAFAEVYVEAVIDHDAWMFDLLNRITKFRFDSKHTPHIIFNVKFTPTDKELLDSYTVTISMEASTSVASFDKILRAAAEKHVGEKTYPQPVEAITDVENALAEAMEGLASSLGNTLAPDLMVRLHGEIFWDGHEIPILETDGNIVELEAVDKNGVLIPSAQLEWKNANPFESRGSVDLTNVNSVAVGLKRTTTNDSLKVTVLRPGASDDLNEMLKMIIVEVLTKKKQEAQDTIVLLKKDSVDNLGNLTQQIALLESDNLAMEETGVGFTSVYGSPQYFPDSANYFKNDPAKVAGFNFLKKRKKIQTKIRRKANVVAFADLVVDRPEMVTTLLDELLKNSGRLIARLILNRDSEGQRDQARNIVIDFLNNNIERIAGGHYPETMSIVQPLPPVVVTTQLPTYQPGKLYHISSKVNFPGRAAFEDSLKQYLSKSETPIFVTVNYSQDVASESFIGRNKGTRPKGLPPGYKYLTFTLVNIPGSIQYDLAIDGENADKTLDASNDIGGTMLNALPEKSAMQISAFASDDGTTSYSLAGTQSFITPSGNIITIDNLSSVGFVTTFPGKIPAGSLTRFKLESEEVYMATYTDNFTKFAGYVKLDKTPYPAKDLPVQPQIYLGYPDKNCTIDIYTISSTMVRQTGVNTILPAIDYPTKEHVGFANDTEACLKSNEAKYYYNQCIAESGGDSNATTSDCYATALQIDKFSPELLAAYRDVHNTQNNVYTQSAVQSLGSALEAFLTEYNRVLVSVRNSTDPKVIIPLLRTWTSATFTSLSAVDRLHIAKVLAKGNLTDINNPFTVFTSNDGGENVMAVILKTAPTSQAEEIIKGFNSVLDENSTLLFSLLKHNMDDAVIGDDSYQKYVFELVRLYYHSSLYTPFENGNVTIENTFLFNGMGMWDGHGYILNEPPARTKTDYYCVINLDGQMTYHEWDLGPFATIKVISKVKLPLMTEEFGGRYYLANVPAFYLKYLFDKKSNANRVEFALTSVAILANAYTMGIGGQLMASTDKLLWTIGLLDVMAGISTTTILTVKPIVATKYGTESGAYKCINTIDRILLVYGGARLVTDLMVLPNLHREAAELWAAERTILKNDGIVTQQQYDDIERLIANDLKVVTQVTLELKAVQISDDVLALGDDLAENAARWLDKNIGDGYVDVIIHARNNETFSVMRNGITEELSVSKLADELRAVDNTKTLRLLSCSGPESATELSRILGRDVVGSEGAMKLYDNGFIETGSWYRARPNGTLDAAPGIPLRDPTIAPSAKFVELGVAVAKGAVKFSDQIDNTIARLTGKAKYSLTNTGEYQIVKGHHPVAKKAFEGDLAYDYQKAFSVPTSELDKAAGITNIHPSITGQQNSLYTAWLKANPTSKLTIDVMADIEIQAMKNVGIPEDVATGWVVKALEDLKAQGVTEIKNIPWNGVN